MEAALDKYDKINLGAGRQHLSGYLNVDILETPETDYVCDLSVRPWPFPSNQYNEIIMNQVLEHLPDLISTMEEIHRIATKAAKIIITVPYFSSVNAFRDPTHKIFFTYCSLDYFNDASPYSYYSRP